MWYIPFHYNTNASLLTNQSTKKKVSLIAMLYTNWYFMYLILFINYHRTIINVHSTTNKKMSKNTK